MKGKFENEAGGWDSDVGAIIRARINTEQVDKFPELDLPLRPINPAELELAAEPVLYRLGHSTVLIKLDGQFILTDPVFSERASPVQWAGPRRFHPVPVPVDELPMIKAVVISHDHYDHLDKQTIKALDKRVEHFVVPLGVGRHLKKWGISRDRIVELDWWQGVELGSIKLTATPAQHFSGRMFFDSNRTLWASWVIESSDSKLFFSGDSGYFDGFRQIGERFGPFDITMIETGAYNPLWSHIHMLPEDGVQAHLDLRGRAMLPIHNSTFDLSLHPWYEPLERASELAQVHGINLLTPVIGAPVQVNAPLPTYAWWRGLESDSESLASTATGQCQENC